MKKKCRLANGKEQLKMANRRMFSLDVINTDKFLDMPVTAQCLYFHLGMRADDDGFVSNPKQIVRFAACTQGDIKVLIENGFIIPFESGIIVIRHWKQHNYIQSDRYRKTKYLEELQHLKINQNVYILDTENIQAVHEMEAQVRLELGKDRVRDSIELGDTVCPEPDKPAAEPSGVLLPLNDNSFYDVPQDKINLWVQAYQAVDVMQELQKMRAWLDSNPTRRKTRRGSAVLSIHGFQGNRTAEKGICRTADRDPKTVITTVLTASGRMTMILMI